MLVFRYMTDIEPNEVNDYWGLFGFLALSRAAKPSRRAFRILSHRVPSPVRRAAICGDGSSW